MILVTGATGNVGSELVAELAAGGHPLRVLTRDPRKLAHLDARVERVIGNLDDRAALARAFAGVERVFMMALLGDESGADRLAVEEAERAGVRHVVQLSSLAPATTIIGARHHQREQSLLASRLGWTLLKPGAFMSNAFQWAATVRARGAVFSALGQGRIAPIAPRDIARVAAHALTSDGHAGQSYELTGPEELTMAEQVRILGEAIGRPLTCIDVTPDEAVAGLRAAGLPTWLTDGMAEMWTGLRGGARVLPRSQVAALTGQAPQTFAEWCREHRAAFA